MPRRDYLVENVASLYPCAVNQSGGTVDSGASLSRIGMGNSTGVYNLSGRTLIFGRESGGYSARIGDENASASGTLNISGEGTAFRTRSGVHVGRSGATGLPYS